MAGFAEYFQTLVGVWKLDRKISDGSKFVGTADFSADDLHFLLSEKGKLILADGSSMEAQRNWVWQSNAKNLLEIYYNENPLRLYHSVKLTRSEGGWIGSASHLCTPDIYEGAYHFCDGEFQIDQQVTGPKKDYSITSLYSS